MNGILKKNGAGAMNIRHAETRDIDRIGEIYESIHDSEESGKLSIGWARGVYPVRKTAEDAVARGDMFVLEDDGVIAASAIINHIQPDAYLGGRWEHEVPEEKIMVLHTLTVDPKLSGKGCGTAFVRYYEEYSLKHGCPYLRMDTQEINTAARALYRKLGYSERDTVPCVFNGIEGVQLVLLEKKLT